MFFHIKVSSKDKKVLENFGQFLSKLEMTSNFLKSFSKQNTRKFVTILKSPHVNKTAQEQFEFRFYTKEFVISSFKPLTFFLILKKVNNLSFSGMNLKVKSLFKRNEKKKVIAVNPDNTNLNTVKSHGLVQKKNLKQKMFNNKSFKTFDASFLASKRYIQLFDCYGEMSLKNDFYLK
jgi:ribosomal protein S10